MHKIALYDMDKTITRRATFGPFLLYSVPRMAPWRLIFLPLVLITTLAYGLGMISRARLKELNLGLMLGGKIHSERLAKVSKGFAAQTLATNLLQQAKQKIESDRAEGYQVVIASASYVFYVRAVGEALGVDDVIGTVATDHSGTISPKIVGENCYGMTKLDMVRHWLAEHSIARDAAHIRFYSDHVSDAPCLEWADEAFATNPHPPLRALAQARGWAIKDWL